MKKTILFYFAASLFTVNSAFALPGSGTQEDPYRIESEADFDNFAADPNYWDDCTRLDADISLDGTTTQCAVIAPDINSSTSGFQGTSFTGVFDGNDHRISGVYIWLSYMHPAGTYSYLGLFGKVDSGAVIKNLNIDSRIEVFSVNFGQYAGGLVGENHGIINNCRLVSAITVEGGDSIGGLAGYSSGEISNCSCSGIINADGDYAGGLVGDNDASNATYCYADVLLRAGGDYVGGLIGRNEWSQITKCYALGNIEENAGNYAGGLIGYNGYSSNISNCYAQGRVEGTDYVGGLVGRHTNSSIHKCYSAGYVSGTNHCGGLVGDSDDTDPDVYNSYWDKMTSDISDGGTGKETIEMRRENTFADWDFENIWRIDENWKYPDIRFYNRADLNTDRIVNFKDFAILADNWLYGAE